MAVIDTCVLLCGLAFPDSDSGHFLKKVATRQVRGVVSNTIMDEALHICKQKAPYLETLIHKFITQYALFVEINESDIYEWLRDPNDNHIIATAIKSGENLIYTLDLGFFTEKTKIITAEYGIEAQFPSFEWYRDDPLKGNVDLPNYKPRIGPFKGAVTILFSAMWNSKDREHIKKKWFVLDYDGIFGLWYETHKQAFRLFPYHLGSQCSRSIPKTFTEKQFIRCTVSYSVENGFDLYIDNLERHYSGTWKPIFAGPEINIGHSSKNSDHFNGIYQGIRVFGDYLPQRIVRIMHKYGVLSVSDKDLEIAEKQPWLLQRRI